MFCAKCGAKQVGAGKFCQKCGAPMGAAPPRQPNSPFGLPAAALIGAASAVAAGVLLSYVCFRIWISAFISSLVNSSGNNYLSAYIYPIRSFFDQAGPKLSFMNYYSYHHVAIQGSGSIASGGANVMADGSYVVPMLISTLIPIIAIGFGGYLAARLRGVRNVQSIAQTGVTTGVVYAVLMVFLRPFAAMHSDQFQIPIPIGVIGSIPMPALSLGPGFLSTVFYTLLFGVVCGWIGARIYSVGWRFWRVGQGDPKWLASLTNSPYALGARAVFEGAVASTIVATLVIVVLFVKSICDGSVQWSQVPVGATLLSYVQVMPTLGGAAYFYAHDIPLTMDLAMEGGPQTNHVTSQASLFGGNSSVSMATNYGGASPNSHSDTPPLAYLAILIPAVTIIVAGYRLAASRAGRNPATAALEGAKIAGPYAIFLVLLGAILGGNFSISGGGGSGDLAANVMKVDCSLGPPFFATVLLALVWGAVAGGAGGALAGFFAKPAHQPASGCPNCGGNVPAGSSFCPACGGSASGNTAAPAGLFCPNCGASEPPGTAFCSKCGKKI